jgi:hypothetical protein
MKKLLIDISFDHYIAFLPILLSTLFYIYFITQAAFKNKFSVKWVWIVTVTFVFFIRSNDFFLKSLNPDEEQWLICANSLLHSPSDYFTSFFLFDYSRIITILPIAFMGLFTKFSSYDSARFVNISLFLIFTFFQFRIIELLFNKKIAIFIIGFLAINFSLAVSPDLIAYNSEMPAIVIISILIFLFVREQKLPSHKITSLLAGILTSFIPFCKEQALPFSIIFVVFFSIKYIKGKEYNRLLLYIIGGLLGLSIILIPLICLYGIDKIVWLISYLSEYSKLGVYFENHPSMNDRVLRSFKIIWLNKEHFALLSISLVSFFIITMDVFKRKNNKRNFLNEVFLLSLFFISVFVIVYPKDTFFHYTILTWVSCYIICGYLFLRIDSTYNPKVLTLILIALFVSKIYDGNWRLIYPISEIRANDYIDQSDPVNNFLSKNTSPGDGMVVWGWANNYFINFELQRASRNTNSMTIINKYSSKQNSINLYIEDLKKFKPKVIIELAGEKRFYLNNKEKYSIENSSSELMNFINSKYSCVESGSNYVFYKLKK